ncbi:MAG: GNAT family N-acetyltransferase [Acidimicrobiaceae bacterium]|nr:GNAT family N-acetyltransferase [Acidimicrobiaceae bacterium]
MSARLGQIEWPRRTERLAVRRASVDDIDAIFAIRSQPGVSEWLTTAADDRDVFQAHYAAPDRLAKTLVVELEGEIIGDTMVSLSNAWSQTEIAAQAVDAEAELGWVIAPAHQGRGYAREVIEELFRLCFDDLGVRRITAGCFAANEASWRLMERLGMWREYAGRRDGLHRSGRWMDGLAYAIDVDEWRTDGVRPDPTSTD